MVPAEGAAHMEADHELPARLLRDREVINQPVETLLSAARSGKSTLSEISKANMFEEKLQFLLQIVNQWIGGGGLGCAQPSDEQLHWTGLWVKDHSKKVDWITVGRRGGDVVKA